MTGGNDLGELLVELRQRRGLSQRGLAKVSGISNTRIASFETGRGTRGQPAGNPTPETLRLLARGLATDQITNEVSETEAAGFYARLMSASGYGQPERLPPDADVPPTPIRRQSYRLSLLRTAIRASAGPRGWDYDGGGFQIDEALLGDAEPEHLIVITASGDCMEPDINDGEQLIVDTSRTTPKVDDVYFIWSPDEGSQVKRLVKEADGLVFKDNKGRFVWPREVRIVGTVVGSFRRF